MKERFSQLGIVSDFEFLVGEEADYEVLTAKGLFCGHVAFFMTQYHSLVGLIDLCVLEPINLAFL
jgi:hypothetical protein